MRALSAEFRLAAACSIWPPSDGRNEAIREAATDPLDWDRFLRVIRRHRVVGLAHDGLARAKVEVPPDVTSDLGEQAVTLTQQSLVLAAEALRLQRLFDAADLPVVFIKGAPLAMLAYGNIGLRQSKDLDLLVPVESIEAATALVERAGYRRHDPPDGLSDTQLRLLIPMRRDFGYLHEHRKVELELHWRLMLNPHLLNETSVFTSSRIVPLSESGVELTPLDRTLDELRLSSDILSG